MKIKDAKPGMRVQTKLGPGTISHVSDDKIIYLVMDKRPSGRKDLNDMTWSVRPRGAKIIPV